MRPVVSVPFHTAGTFLEPRLGVEYTQYLLGELDQPATGTTAEETPNRLLPILSVNSGLLFERDLGFGGRTFLQTLEPRFFYLYIPEVNRRDLRSSTPASTPYRSHSSSGRIASAARIGSGTPIRSRSG